MNVIIRKAQASDVTAMMKLVHELAEFEKQPSEVKNTEEQMLREGFSVNPSFFAIVADIDGAVQGMSVYFYSYSTWKGKSIYIDDIIVNEAFRGLGVGRKLMEATIEEARDQNVGKLHWQVLDWNEPAIKFYKKYNPSFDGEWINCAVSKEQLSKMDY